MKLHHKILLGSFISVALPARAGGLLAPVGRRHLGRNPGAGDVALVTGAGQARAARQREQAGEGQERGQGQAGELQGRSFSGAPPAENGAERSATGIRSPAGSE